MSNIEEFRLNTESIQRISMLAISGQFSHRQIGRTHNISKSTVSRYVKYTREGKKVRENGGRPCLLDTIAIDEMKAIIDRQEITTNIEFKQNFIEKAKESIKRRYFNEGILEIGAIQVSRRTLKRYRDQFGFVEAK